VIPGTHRRSTQVRGLIKAAHPGPSIAVTALTTSLAASVGLSAGRCAALAAGVLCGQLSVGWANDLLDRERDVAAGRGDKPVALGLVSVRAVRTASATALLLAIPLSFVNGWRSALAHLVFVGCGWAYDLGLKATRWSFVPYAVGFGALPAVATLALPEPSLPPAWGIAAGALLGVGAHMANALPDVEEDRAAGVLGMPQRLGPRAARTVGAAALVAGTAALAVGPGFDLLGAIALLTAGGLAFAAFAVRWPAGSRTPFVLTVSLVVVDVALLLLRGADLA
jgi:4-hydroxybenzoate polyprenyltransferase